MTEPPRVDGRRWAPVGARRAALLATVVVAACGGDEARAPSRGAADDAGVDEELSEADLAALGYVELVDDSAESTPDAELERGLVHSDPRASDGYTLVVCIGAASALLLDADGVTRHRWSDDACEQWNRVQLAPDGDVLVVGRLKPERPKPGEVTFESGPPGSKRVAPAFLARYHWNGELVWRRLLRAHHDIEWTPSGDVLTIVDDPRHVDGRYLQDDRLTLLTPDGEVRRAVSLYDVLTSRPDLYSLPDRIDLENTTRPDGRVDLFHTNSAEWMPFDFLVGATPLHRATSVLVSVRHLSLLAILDFDTAELLWVFGPGEIEYPHEATWLANGNVLLFDNGSTERGWSRVVEVDPRADEIVWEYEAPEPTDFFSHGRGTAKALPNGNVQIASSNQGAIFEVTRAGEVVWRYVRRRGRQLVVVRAEHYPAERVEPLLAR